MKIFYLVFLLLLALIVVMTLFQNEKCHDEIVEFGDDYPQL